MEGIANAMIENAKMIPPAFPKPCSKQAIVKAAPSIPSLNNPLLNTTRAVNTHTTIVSKNTSKIPQKPCSTALASSTLACEIGELPIPASLLNTPRDIP